MKKQFFAFMVLALAVPALVFSADNRTIKPSRDGVIVLNGETFTLDAGPGATCKAPTFPLDRPDEKATDCTFRAVNTGETEVEILKPVPRKVKVKSSNANELPRVTIADLTRDPAKFGEGLIMLEGENRGWGAPAKAKEVWGPTHTRSDWILEDETGATYITGTMKPDIKFARVVVLARQWQGKWALHAVRVEQAEVVLKGDRANELRVGQVGVIKVFPNKSEVVTYKINGEAVKLEADTRDEIKVTAVAPGEAEVLVYLRWFNDGYGIDGPEPAGSTAKPTMVVKIKVVP